ncbi:MAG: hypothetical protein RIT25_1869, partial [Planctomycetota bacterium]
RELGIAAAPSAPAGQDTGSVADQPAEENDDQVD